jgi:glycerol-3-phosphate dehydrogenase
MNLRGGITIATSDNRATVEALLALSGPGHEIREISPDQAVAAYAGVRPLYDDAAERDSAVTRDYVLALDRGWDGRAAPLLSVFGGKITTYRRLAEHALAKLGIKAPPWTASAPLPGGDIPDGDFAAFLAAQRARYPWAAPAMLARMAHAYGTRLTEVLGDAQGAQDLGQHFGCGLHAAEVIYLIRQEWARSAEDVLWRRSKLGLHLTGEEQARLAQWFARLKLDDQAISAAIQSASAR